MHTNHSISRYSNYRQQYSYAIRLQEQCLHWISYLIKLFSLFNSPHGRQSKYYHYHSMAKKASSQKAGPAGGQRPDEGHVWCKTKDRTQIFCLPEVQGSGEILVEWLIPQWNPRTQESIKLKVSLGAQSKNSSREQITLKLRKGKSGLGTKVRSKEVCVSIIQKRYSLS